MVIESRDFGGIIIYVLTSVVVEDGPIQCFPWQEGTGRNLCSDPQSSGVAAGRWPFPPTFLSLGYNIGFTDQVNQPSHFETQCSSYIRSYLRVYVYIKRTPS